MAYYPSAETIQLLKTLFQEGALIRGSHTPSPIAKKTQLLPKHLSMEKHFNIHLSACWAVSSVVSNDVSTSRLP